MAPLTSIANAATGPADVTLPRGHFGPALLAFALLLASLAFTGAWMAREVGRGVMLAGYCDGKCVTVVLERARGS